MSSEVAKTGDDDDIGKVRRLVRQVLLVWRVRSGMVMAKRIDPVATFCLIGSLLNLWAILAFGSDWPQYNLMGRVVAGGVIVLMHAFLIFNFMFLPIMAFVDRYIPRAMPKAPHDVMIDRIAAAMTNKTDDDFETEAGPDVRMAARNGLDFGKGMTDEMIDRITAECLANNPHLTTRDRTHTLFVVFDVIRAIVRQAVWTKWPPATPPPAPKPRSTPASAILALAHVHEHDA